MTQKQLARLIDLLGSQRVWFVTYEDGFGHTFASDVMTYQHAKGQLEEIKTETPKGNPYICICVHN